MNPCQTNIKQQSDKLCKDIRKQTKKLEKINKDLNKVIDFYKFLEEEINNK